MKQTTFILLLILQCSFAIAQITETKKDTVVYRGLGKSITKTEIKADTIIRPSQYLGIGTGINSYTGMLGLLVNFKLVDKVFGQAGLGLGSWGYKATFGFKYDFQRANGWSTCIGYSICSGAPQIEMDLELSTGQTRTVKLDLLPVGLVDFKFTHNWFIAKKHIMFLDLGYAITLDKSPWMITDKSKISTLSKRVLTFSSPGGIILGCGFLFGL